MTVISHKIKQSLLLALKVFIFGLTSWYIYVKLFKNEALDVSSFFEILKQKSTEELWGIIIFIALAGLNWFFEILKWKTVVSVVQKISLSEATKQSLYALTVSLATPNRIGDYGAKAFFYKKEKRKKILLLNFFSNSSQLLVTLFFGVIGIWFAILKYDLPFSVVKLGWLLLVIVGLLILGVLYKNKTLVIKGLSLAQVVNYFKKLSASIKIKTLLFSVIRYVIFSFLFYKILVFFENKEIGFEVIPLIFLMYLLVSILPTLFVFDVIVRTGVAVWIFSWIGISELVVLCTVLSMWLLNFVIPALLGSYFMFTYKAQKK